MRSKRGTARLLSDILAAPANPRAALAAAVATAAIICLPAGVDGQTADIQVARAVYDAVLDTLLRSEPAASVVVLDSTIPVPSHVIPHADERQLSDQLRDVIASTPATALPVLSDASIGRITRADFQRLKREVPTARYRSPVAVVSLSAVFVDRDGARALVYVERWQGPNWSGGSVMQLERHAGAWVITSEWGHWAT